MIAQQRRQEALSNNVANALTPGYKQDQATLKAFPEMLIERMENKTFPPRRETTIPMRTRVGALNTGVYVQETIPDFAQGALKNTGISTDMALVNGVLPDDNGSLFFTVQNAEGETRYTRNGNFTVDGQGLLVSNQGYYVLDQTGNPISTDGQEFNVTAEGSVQVGNQATQLGIAYSANANQLVKEGEGLFRAEDGQVLENARTNQGVTFSVQQNYLENSNVDTAQTMTDMMQAYRMFEANQKVIQAYDQSLDKAVNEIGRLR